MVDDYNYKEVLRKLKAIGKTMRNYTILKTHKFLTIQIKKIANEFDSPILLYSIMHLIFASLNILNAIDTSYSVTNIINDLGYVIQIK